MAVQGALKFGFAAGALFAPCTSAECLRLRNPLTVLWREAPLVPSGTTYVLNRDTGALRKVCVING